MIAIIDSGGANIASVQFALERLGATSVLTQDVSVIQSADRVLLPGVGAAPVAMRTLRDANLIECIRQLRQPVLGICLGMQLLFSHSDEGNTDLLGVLEGRCTAFTPAPGRAVPHMGWNSLQQVASHPLMAGVPASSHVYFVHSFFVPASDTTIAACDYGDRFTAIAAHKNFMGCQFHPERSGQVGAQILKNFLEMPS
jgi:glutamine amidotransferase